MATSLSSSIPPTSLLNTIESDPTTGPRMMPLKATPINSKPSQKQADLDRQQKLEVARKKLQKFQKRAQTPPITKPPVNDAVVITPADPPTTTALATVASVELAPVADLSVESIKRPLAVSSPTLNDSLGTAPEYIEDDRRIRSQTLKPLGLVESKVEMNLSSTKSVPAATTTRRTTSQQELTTVKSASPVSPDRSYALLLEERNTMLSKCRWYEEQLKRLQGETLKRRTTSADAEDEVVTLKRQLNESRGRLDGLQKQNLIILRNANQVEEVNKQLNRKNLELVEKIKSQSERISWLEEETLKPHGKVSALDEEHSVEELRKTMEGLQKKNVYLEQRVQEREKKIQDLVADLSSLTQSLQLEENKTKSLTVKLNEQAQNLSLVGGENESLKEKTRLLEEQLEAMQKDLTENKKASEIVESHNKQHEKDLQSLLDEAREENHTLNTKVEQEIELANQLSRNLKEKEVAYYLMGQENRAMLQQLNELREKFDTAMNENSQTTIEAEKANKVAEKLQAEVEAMVYVKEEIERLKTIIRDQTEADYQNKASTMEVMDALHQKNAAYEAEIRTLKTQLKAIQVPLPDSPEKKLVVDGRRISNKRIRPSVDEEMSAEVDQDDKQQPFAPATPSPRSPSPLLNAEAIDESTELSGKVDATMSVLSEKYGNLLLRIGDLEQELTEVYIRLAELKSANEKLLDENVTYKDLKEKYDSVVHLNERLQMEAETVPLYIERYHQERRILRFKSLQKDRVIKEMVDNYNELLVRLDEDRSKESMEEESPKERLEEEKSKEESERRPSSTNHLIEDSMSVVDPEMDSPVVSRGPKDHSIHTKPVKVLLESFQQLADEAEEYATRNSQLPSPESETFNHSVDRSLEAIQDLVENITEFPACPECSEKEYNV